MRAINKVQDVHRDTVVSYEGLLSCLVYSTAHRTFRQSITDNWQALNDWSGRRLLILVADAAPANATPQPLPRKDLMHMMVSMPGFVSGSTDKTNLDVAKQFGVKRSDMPCIVFFNNVSAPETLIYSFKTDKDVVGSMMAIFDDCEKAWVEKDSYADLHAYRSQMMYRLETLLNQRRFLRFAERSSQNAAFTGILSAMIGWI